MTSYKKNISPFSNNESNFSIDFSMGFEVSGFNSSKKKKQPKIFNVSTFREYEKENAHKAFDYCQKCFTKNPNDEKLMNMLGYCYAYGVGTVVNKKRAFECYKKATELDNKNASYWKNLGDCYMNGIGTEKNERKAFECFLKCKKDYLKDPYYFAFIGLCYFKGIGTEINKEKAKKMFQKALEIKPDCKDAKELLAKCIDE